MLSAIDPTHSWSEVKRSVAGHGLDPLALVASQERSQALLTDRGVFSRLHHFPNQDAQIDEFVGGAGPLRPVAQTAGHISIDGKEVARETVREFDPQPVADGV